MVTRPTEQRRLVIATPRIARLSTALAVFVLLTIALRGAREGFNIRSAHAVVIDNWAVDLRLRLGLNIRAATVSCSIAVWATRIGFTAVAFTLLATRRWASAVILVVVAVASLNLVEHVLKPAIDRRTIAAPGFPPGPPVFPSGQATVLGVLATIALTTRFQPSEHRLRRTLKAIGVLTIVVSSVGLIHSGCHYASDVVGGLAVGVAITELTHLLWLIAAILRARRAALSTSPAR